MLPINHLLQLNPLRIESAARRLEAGLWWEVQPLAVEATEAGPDLLSWKEAIKRRRRPVEPGSAWGKLFDQRWCRIVLPKPTRGDSWFSWRDQGEATLYLKGEPWFGFDVAHRHCRLPSGTKELWIESNCVQSAIWHPRAVGLSAKGSVFEGADLCRRNDEAWHAFHDLKCLFDVALTLRQQENVYLPPQVAPGSLQPAVEKHSPEYRRLLRVMDEAVDALDRDGPAAARVRLAAGYEELRGSRSLMRCVLSGHAHIDLVWLWPERIGELKAVHTFATVSRLLEEYPEMRFAYSQPASYEAVERRAPRLSKKVMTFVRAGQWSATGAMYVESDTLIACGEALWRSFMMGQEAFTRLKGSPATLTWLPDVFGYSACLPQMMRMAGARYFFTTKLTWNFVNRFPYSSFLWRGNDGSEVIAHVTQDAGYNGQTDTGELKASSWGHQQGDIHREYLLPTGFGDGGGGPTAEMCERARRLGRLPGMPEVVWDQPEDFFARLEPLRNRLPVYQGECYLEGHRGTFTTHGEVKAAFRNLERALQSSEAVSCVTGKRWDRSETWKRLVFAQFHDYIPGSSVWDVYLEGIPELRSLAESESAKARAALAGSGGVECLFNPHAVPVTHWIPRPRSKKPVRVQLPALGGCAVGDAILTEPCDEVRVTGSSVSNGLVEFRLDKNGWLDRLAWGGESMPLRGPAGQLWHYRDQPARFEAWDLDRQTLAGGEVCRSKAKIEVFTDGAHRAGFRVHRRAGGSNEATVTFFLEAGSPLLHVEVDLDWREPHALLKLCFPTRYAATHARFGIPYSSVLRPQTASGSHSEAMWEVPFSRWLAVFDEGERAGLFAVTEAKYGASVRDGTIGISLVRSPLAAGCDGLRVAWPPHLSRLPIPSPHTDIGQHSIRLAFGNYHCGLSRADHPASVANTLFSGPLPYRGKPVAAALQSLEGGDSLIPEWAMPIDAHSWLLRLHEVSGHRGTLRVRAAAGWKTAPCDALGKSSRAGRRETSIDFTPYQIVSVLFKKERS